MSDRWEKFTDLEIMALYAHAIHYIDIVKNMSIDLGIDKTHVLQGLKPSIELLKELKAVYMLRFSEGETNE